MSAERSERRRRILDPLQRSMETLFGLIMVLSFTSTLSAATAGREEVRTMVFAALGCNLAWGIVDGVMYLLNALAERARGLRLLQGLRRTDDPGVASRIIAEALPSTLASVMTPPEFESLHRRLKSLPEPPRFASLTRQDLVEAFAVLLVVLCSTFPPVIPFMIFPDTVTAMRISSLIALLSLFVVGYRIGNYASHRPWRTGFSMMGIGLVLVLITIALGG